MQASRSSRNTLASAVFLFASAVCAAPPAAAFLINVPPSVTVTEFWNVHLNHYFLTANPVEMAAIDAGAAGPGWMRTGYGFTAYAYKAGQCYLGCENVSRFYGTPGLGPNSHFYTANADEAAGLKKPGTGWSFERDEFAVYVPDESGVCPAGLAPIRRFYNNRWMFNDSNHRYVTRESERQAMVAQGWIDEGVRFCTLGLVEVPFATFAVDVASSTEIRPSHECEDESVNLGPCIAVNNLATPNRLLGPYATADAELFTRKTGLRSEFVHASVFGGPELAASVPFVQNDGFAFGLHVDTRGRPPGSLASINPLFQFRTDAAGRFFPWEPRHYPVQLSIRAALNVVKLVKRNGQSHAYGHPTLELIDRASGQHLYFTIGAYGTVAPADFVAIDSFTGNVIVSTPFRAGSAFGRNAGRLPIYAPEGLDYSNGLMAGGVFEFRVDRDEFQRILDAARTANPALSSNPADYYFDNFHFNNEVVGDGEIGMNLNNFRIEVLRR